MHNDASDIFVFDQRNLFQVSVAAFLISIGSSSWEVSVPEDGLLSGIFYNIELTRNELRLNGFTLSSNDRWENRRRILSSYLDALVFGGLEQGNAFY